MGLETGSTISSLITSNPTSSDPVNQGDDHIRLLKSVLQAQFPGAGGLGFAIPITTTEAELNALHGLVNYNFASGTRMPFAQAAAPTGWTQDVSDNANNRMLRVINSAGGGVGGSADPTLNNTVPYHTHGFTTGGVSANHQHFDSGHTHSFVWKSNTGGTTAGGDPNSVGNVTVSTGAGNANIGFMSADHTHSGGTDGGSSQTNWSPRYINMIICSKN
jgi:hypothetical protein